jgi:nitrogen fixation NifU-like protein
MDDLYRELIIDRYKNPHYRGELDPYNISYEDDNPLCGDKIRIDIRVDKNDIITEALFTGQGCSISLASADLVIESIIGKSLDDLKQMKKEDVLDLLGIELGPVRLKCALLSLKVIKAGVYGLGVGEATDELVE